MVKRQIIKINLNKCNGCGECIPNCPEGALQVIDGKVRLISDLFCDGLGACIGYCPQGAISIEERDAQEYDERKVMENIIKQGENVIKAHLSHLNKHNQDEYFKQAIIFLNEKGIKNPFLVNKRSGGNLDQHAHSSGCPGSKIMDFRDEQKSEQSKGPFISGKSELRQWPIQIMLVLPFAPYLENADLLISADCVSFAYADFHRDLLKDKTLLVGCPKLDDLESYREKITAILKLNQIKSITYAHMEVPCCFGLVHVIQQAIVESGKKIPFKEVTISIGGKRLE